MSQPIFVKTDFCKNIIIGGSNLAYGLFFSLNYKIHIIQSEYIIKTYCDII